MYDSRLVMSDSATPRTATQQAPLSMEFSRQEYWGGLSFPSPGDLPNPGTEPRSPTFQTDSLPSEPPGTQSLSDQILTLISFIRASMMAQMVKKKYACIGGDPG